MLDHRPAVRFYDLFGGNIYFKKQREGYEPLVQWIATGAVAAGVLRVIQPFLISKVEAVALCLEFAGIVEEKGASGSRFWTQEQVDRIEGLRARLRALHHPNRGPKPIPPAGPRPPRPSREPPVVWVGLK